MITVGTMRLPQPEPLDDLDAFLRGLEPDGGYWLTVRRLADHDHSGGVMGVPVAGGGGTVDAYTKAQSDARYEPIDTMYTKAESDARYQAIGSYLTQAAGDLRYEPIDTMYTKGESDARYALASALTALTTRVAALETSVAALKTHTHRLGTFTGVQSPAGGIP